MKEIKFEDVQVNDVIMATRMGTNDDGIYITGIRGKVFRKGDVSMAVHVTHEANISLDPRMAVGGEWGRVGGEDNPPIFKDSHISADVFTHFMKVN